MHACLLLSFQTFQHYSHTSSEFTRVYVPSIGLRTCDASLPRMFAAATLGSEPSGMDQGQRAKWVSNASFATLTLIYTFTQILDLGTQVSTLAGVTLRVGRLLQVM